MTTDEAGETTVCRGVLVLGELPDIRAPALPSVLSSAGAGLRPRRNGRPQVSPLARDQSPGQAAGIRLPTKCIARMAKPEHR